MASGSQQRPDLEADPLLAGALDACLSLEQDELGSSAETVQAAPTYLQLELQRLIEEGRALRAVVQAPTPAPEFREAARARLVATMAAANERTPSPIVAPRAGQSWLSWSRSGSAWLKAAAACLVAIAVVSYSAVSASASALPGDPLYAVKLTRESADVRLAPSAVARATILLEQAEVRLGEVDRLLQDQRLAEVASTMDRYAAALADAADALLAAPPAERLAVLAQFQTRLDGQRMHLEMLVRNAPPGAAPALRNALAVATQGLARIPESGAVDAPPTATTLPTVAPVLQASPTATMLTATNTVSPNRVPAASPIASLSPTAGTGSLSATAAPSAAVPTERATPGPTQAPTKRPAATITEPTSKAAPTLTIGTVGR